MADPITRREYLFVDALTAGASPFLATEAIASTALSHEPGWLDELVDPETGEEMPRFILAENAAPCLVCSASTRAVEVNYEACSVPGVPAGAGSARGRGRGDLDRPGMTTTTAFRLDLPRWDVGPRVPYRTKTGKARTRMHRPVWDALTGNARTGHWSQRSKAVAEVVDAVMWIATAARVPAGSHLTVQLAWAPGDHRRADAPNLHGLQKPCVDALVRLGIVEDDTAQWVTELMPRIDRPPVPAGLWLELEVRP